jgi:TetR/AcrR family transcriptional regulator, transcriptional repressor for nem operon
MRAARVQTGWYVTLGVRSSCVSSPSLILLLQQTIRSGSMTAVSRDPSSTRARILDAAEALVLERGYGGASLEAMLDQAGATKGAFFHHFESKASLARALVERSAAADAARLLEVEAEADRLSEDPLEQVLIMVGIVEEEMSTRSEPFRGSLVASCSYQAGLLDEGTLAVGRRALRRWRDALSRRLRRAAEIHPPRLEIDADSLADAFIAILEGSFVLSKSYEDGGVVSEQLTHYHTYLELLFGVEG